MFLCLFAVDTFAFCAWLQTETWWLQLLEQVEREWKILQKAKLVSTSDCLVDMIKDWKRQYSGLMYEDDCETLKGGPQANKKRVKEHLEKAARRSIYRCVLHVHAMFKIICIII